MLKTTAQLSPDLQAFIQSLDLPLNQAQERHTTQVAGVLVEKLRGWGPDAPPLGESCALRDWAQTVWTRTG